MHFLLPNTSITLRSENFELGFKAGDDAFTGEFYWRDAKFRDGPAKPDGIFIEFSGEFRSSRPGDWIPNTDLAILKVAVEDAGNWKNATGTGILKSGFIKNPAQSSVGIHVDINANIEAFGRVAYERLDGFGVV